MGKRVHPLSSLQFIVADEFMMSCYAGTPGIASILLAMPPGMAAIPVRNISYDLLWKIDPAYLAYWSTLAQRYGEPILEIMCGTGGIAIPLAQQGFRLTGLELAAPMLSEAKRKSEIAGVTIDWVAGDARNFDLRQQYNLIYLPGNSICHLLTRTDLEGCLRSVMRHLHPEGRFAVSVFVPSLPLLLQTPEEEQELATYVDPDTNAQVVITHRSWYDPATQIRHNKLYQRVDNGPVEADGELTMRMYFPQELDALFWYNGFAVEHKYGDHDFNPFDAESSSQFYVLKRRSG
jgi:2-polyprenyl-3-methyl-5-hydroxy-6-metoxy-1,4-benzoquinol methylase